MGYEMPRVKDTANAFISDASICVFCALVQSADVERKRSDRVAFTRWNTRCLSALAFAHTVQLGWFRFFRTFPCTLTFFSEVCASLLLTPPSSPAALWSMDGENALILPISLLPSLTFFALLFSELSFHVTCLDFYPQFF